MMSNGITWWELMIALQLSGKFLSVLEVPFPVKNPLYKVNRTRSSKKITTYCCNILIKPKSSASESIEDIKRYSWAWMSDRCTSFSQQEWVLCHAKTTHLSINTLYPHMGQSDIRSMMWYMYFGKNKFIVICRCMQYTISRTKIHVCNNRTLKTDTERVWSWKLTWL